MAERQYYQDLILQHKADIKKSWQVIKSIINNENIVQSTRNSNTMGILLVMEK